MCGITGYWNSFTESNSDEIQNIVQKMAMTLLHRGPDDGGEWIDEEAGVALGHRRLAILDLSPEGHQPMVSAEGRYIIVFNGEIYNFLELKQDLEKLGHRFRGHSDTEVMLTSFSQWGLMTAVKRFVGMFAFALWDRKERILHLGRDRMGEKPLYYGWMGKTFLFGSELKPLRIHPDWQGEINRDALALLLRHNYIDAPYSIYKNIYKLPPGTLLTVPSSLSRPKPTSYWSAKEVVEKGAQNPFKGNEQEAIAQLDRLLRETIGQQMIADVPLGAFLSGGIDSSTIVALMQSQSSRPIKTFSIGFEELEYNEAPYAKKIANHLGTDHTELYITPQEAMAVIPKLANLYDEPFSDSSQIPTFLVSQLAKQQVTVSLSGDGGDELFGGYRRYFAGDRFARQFQGLSRPVRNGLANLIRMRSPQAWETTLTRLKPFLPETFKQLHLGEKFYRVADLLTLNNPEAMYRRLVSHWVDPDLIVLGATEPNTALNNPELWPDLSTFFQSLMYFDTITYLPGDILVKVDRAAMGVSLESRIPFLDHRVVEWVWTVPQNLKVRQNQGKWLLRQVLGQYVPQNLFERPKMGFGVPIDKWLRGALRDWAENLLSEKRLRDEGFFDPQPIRQKWEEHLSGQASWQYYLWDVLMFQMWLDANHSV